MGAEVINSDSDNNEWLSTLTYDQWVSLPVSGSRPSARYKHAAEVADGKLYITGGSRNGRYLSDVQVFDLATFTWSTLILHLDPNSNELGDSSSQEVLPATSDHSLVKWGNQLFLLGGHSKEFSDTVTVRSINLETHHCHVVKTSGKVPVTRGGQSVTLFGSRLIMFGGEDANRQLLNDVYILDLETMTWDLLETMQTPPSPRFDHTAALHADRYLLIFGGCSHSICFNDLHILDLLTDYNGTLVLQMEWSQPQTQGDVATPRAGHAGITVNENWYIVGGGDNKSGASETLVLNMSRLVWSVVTSVKERDPLASEGVSLCSAFINGEKLLLAFGGYYGKYNNEVFVLRPKPADLARPKIFQSPAAAAAAASVTAAYGLNSKGERKTDLTNTADSDFNIVQTESSPQDFTVDINLIAAEKKALESSLAEIRAKNSRLEGDLSEMNNNHAELSKELLSVKGQLVAESSRCFKLEAQITELKKSLESLHSIEEELQVLRNNKSALERDSDTAESTQRQNSGVWQWIAGGTRDQ